MAPYTGRGDDGETDLRAGERVSKAHPRIEAYGAVDELNALLGTIRGADDSEISERLERIQHHLHVLQAELANTDPAEGTPTLDPDHVDRIETWIDTHQEELEPLKSFILPGGGKVGAQLHHARAVCRRAERRVVQLAGTADVRQPARVYLNRLSDLLFVLARVANARDGVTEETPSY